MHSKYLKRALGGGGGGGGGGRVGGGGQDGCERRIKVFVKIKKKNIFFFGGGGVGSGGGGGVQLGGQGRCEQRSEFLRKLKINIKIVGGRLGGGGVRFVGSGWM